MISKSEVLPTSYTLYKEHSEGLGKNRICIYETYKNTVMPHGCQIYSKAYDMAKETICAYSQSDHALPHWKGVL